MCLVVVVRSRRPSSRVLCSLVSAALLTMGSALYVCLRPENLLLFRWARAVGVLDEVYSVRVAADWLVPLLPEWVIFSLPYALWVSSYMLAVEVIWYRSPSISKYVWFNAAPAVALVSELAQAARLIPGTFDWVDVALLAIIPTIGFVLLKFIRDLVDEKIKKS